MPDPTPAQPSSWWAGARKFLVALLVGVVAAGGTITAAVADERITLSEWWFIGIAVASAIVGPAAVYSTKNATKAPAVEVTPVEVTGRPVVRAHVDGTIDVAWPDGDPGDAADRVTVPRALLDGMVRQHNQLTLELAQSTRPPAPPRQWTRP